MKILIISHLYPTDYNPYSGIFVHEQVRELRRQGCEVTVVTPIRFAPFPVNYLTKKWNAYSQIPNYEEKDGILIYHPRYVSFPKNILFHMSGTFMYSGIRETVIKLHNEHTFDLIHAHVALPDGYAAMRLSIDLGLPYITTIHGKDLLGSIHEDRKSKKNIVRVISESDRTILVSQRLKKVKDKYLPNISDDKIELIPNGINPIFLEDSPIKESSKGSFILLSVSNLNKFKGIEYNILAMAELVKSFPDIMYFIVGDGIEKQNLEKLVTDLNLEDNVKFLGVKSQLEVKQLMDRADVFSMPSWNEAFGIVYIEAMACGKPVIGCKGEGIEEIVSDGENGFLVQPQDYKPISNLVLKLLNDKVLRETVGKNARKLVQEKYTWKINTKRILDLYKTILDKN